MKRKPFHHEKKCKDHLGNEYSSIKDMCAVYSIKPCTYTRRIKVYGWSIEKALTTPVKHNGGKYCYDHEGRRFKSEKLMCEYWNIERKTFRYRIEHGLSTEEALTRSAYPGLKLNK